MTLSLGMACRCSDASREPIDAARARIAEAVEYDKLDVDNLLHYMYGWIDGTYAEVTGIWVDMWMLVTFRILPGNDDGPVEGCVQCDSFEDGLVMIFDHMLKEYA